MKFLLQNYPDTSAKLGLASEEAKGFGHQHLTGRWLSQYSQGSRTNHTARNPAEAGWWSRARGDDTGPLGAGCTVSGQQLQLKGTALDPFSVSSDY